VVFAALYGVVWLSLQLHRQALKGDYQNKHQDYRALAEGLRIQLFWHLTGLRESVANYYLDEQRDELAWIRHALRNWYLVSSVESEVPMPKVIPLIRAHWIEDQKKYYDLKSQRENQQLERRRHLIRWLLSVSVGITVLLAVLLVSAVLFPWPLLQHARFLFYNEWVHGIFKIGIGMLAVGAGLLHSYNQQRAHKEHAKLYGRMSMLFEIAGWQLNDMLRRAKPEQVPDLIRELGKEALLESAEWLLLHRERPLELLHIGGVRTPQRWRNSQ
jgi:uncharacterized membrane protein YidH (DUF202 family)